MSATKLLQDSEVGKVSVWRTDGVEDTNEVVTGVANNMHDLVDDQASLRLTTIAAPQRSLSSTFAAPVMAMTWMPAAVAICVTIEPVEAEPPFTTSVLFTEEGVLREGYGSPRVAVGTPGRASLGTLTDSAQIAASSAKGTTTPSVKETLPGRIAALLAGTMV